MSTKTALLDLRRAVRKLEAAVDDASIQQTPLDCETALEEAKSYAEDIATEAERLMETFYTADGDRLEQLP